VRTGFHVTTTTGGRTKGAGDDGGLLQTEWPDLKVMAHLDHRTVGGDRGAGAERATRLLAPARDIDIAGWVRCRT